MFDRKYERPFYSTPPLYFATDQELVAFKDEVWFFDIELYHNFLLIAFKCYANGKVVFLEESTTKQLNRDKLRWMVDNLLLVGFNSNHYDRYILWAALAGKWTEELKAVSQAIIVGEIKHRQIEADFGFKCGKFNHIDLQQVAPAAATQLSLKHYGARMNSLRLQELPIHHSSGVETNQQQSLRTYCVNDLDITGLLYHKLREPMALRVNMGRTYNVDLRSKSDAQIAEAVIGTELEAQTGVRYKPPRVPYDEIFKFADPGYLNFQTQTLQQLKQDIYNTEFTVGAEGKVFVSKDGALVSAKNLWKVKIGLTDYTLGIGGLHSREKNRSVYTTSEMFIVDRDVSSYYPNIILGQKLYPHHIGKDFLLVYRDIVERRLKAKAQGDKQTSESLKICINGSFGKLGSRWSIFYSPHLLVQVTISGQLSLLLLIEAMELCGIPCVSANTDGVVLTVPVRLQETYLAVVKWWEQVTGFDTDETPYRSVHSRDVNNYIAICPDGSVKAKGAYVNAMSMSNPDRQTLMTNPSFSICTEAVMRFLQTHESSNVATIDKTIKECTDFTKFIGVRRVNGGATKDKVSLGKVIRWYIRKNDFSPIYRKTQTAAGSTNKVAETDGGCPAMELGVLPKDIDYSWYIRRAHSILRKQLGYGQVEKVEQLKLF